MKLTWALFLFLGTYLACSVPLDHSTGDYFSMYDGLVTHNCTGYFVVHYRNYNTTKSCSDEDHEVYTSPILITKARVSMLLRGYLDCEREQNKLSVNCKKTPRDVYPFVFAGSMIILIPLLCFLCIIVVFMLRTGSRGGREIILTKEHVKMNTPFSDRSYSWREVFCIGLLCQSLVSSPTILPAAEASCISPTQMTTANGTNTMMFLLGVSQKACLSAGHVEIKSYEATHEIDLMYHTSTFNHHSWTALGCGYGLCGTEEECSKWGSLGKTVHSPGRNHFYVKQCTPHPRSFLFCIKTWGCWLSTKEIFWKTEDEHKVYTIGNFQSSVEKKVDGLNECSIDYQYQPDVNSLRGLSLVSGNVTWLCPPASSPNDPKAGRIGDLQIHRGDSSSKTLMEYDFSQYLCDTAALESSGNCEIKKPSMSVIKDHCLKLPGRVESAFTKYDRGILSSVPNEPVRVTITCPSSVFYIGSDHECHSKHVDIEGIREEDHLTSVNFQATSLYKNSTWVVESNCTLERFEIPCDGEVHSLPVYHSDIQNCEFSGLRPEDKRRDDAPSDWQWDHPDHESIITANWSISTFSIVLVVIGLFVVRIFCH